MKKPVKILHIITGLSTGGAEIMLFKLISGMDKTLFHNSVISLTKAGDIKNKFINIGIPVTSLNLSPNLPNPLALLKLILLLRKERPDIIQGWMYHANIAASISRYLSKLSVPLFWNIRNSLDITDKDTTLPKKIIKLSSYLSDAPDSIIYNSRVSLKQHQTISFNSKNAKYIPNGFDCSQFKPDAASRQKYRNELGINNKTICISLIARYHPMKDHKNFLKAASLLIRKFSDIRFILIGEGADSNNPDIVTLVDQFHLKEKILLLGKKNNINNLINMIDIAVSSSYIEGFSNAIGEAMASGIPCVVTDAGDSSYIVGNTGLTVSSRDPHKLCKALEQMIRIGNQERIELGKKARKRIQNNFSLESIVDQYQKLYLEFFNPL